MTLNENILVIGGSRGLGAALVQELQSNDYTHIYILDRMDPKINIPGIEYLYIDLLKMI
jgi:NAD(P)-dependent dehydrogenase (short-subunit alcohol dehydrogenase family)